MKAASSRALQLALSPNRYTFQPRGGAPGSPQRLRAAGTIVQSDDPNAVARRAEKRRIAVEYLIERDATAPSGRSRQSQVVFSCGVIHCCVVT